MTVAEMVSRTDAELLAAYASGGPESAAAFEQLVRRHGGMVHHVCLRLLGEPESTQDAAQATFLVLARKARAVRGSVGTFLHGAARRVAGYERRARAIRRAREKEAAQMRPASYREEPERHPAEWESVRLLLDEAIGALPGDQREAVILHYLEGRSHREVAVTLGISADAASSRIKRALAGLRERLARSGVALGVTALGPILAARAAEAVCPAYLAAAAGSLAAAGTAGGAVVGANVLALAKGAVKAMFWTKVTLAAAVLGAAVVVGGGGTMAVRHLAAGELPANQWVQLKDAGIGQYGRVAVVYSPEVGRFLALGDGWRWYGKDDKPYEDLALDPAEGKWENWYPTGKSFGPKFGPCQPPNFKDFYGSVFVDVDGNNRANPNAHMWQGVYNLSAHDPDTKMVYFHSGRWTGMTWCYDLVTRKWEGIETATYPAKEGVGPLLWSSMCYDAERKRIVLFGGGNVQSERGDPGTWIFDPATKQWQDLKLDQQPPPRANSRLAYDPIAKKVVLFGGDGLDQLYTDTWTFDGQKWEERKPAFSPAPRAGHALLWLPKAKKILLLGGYGYDSGGGYGGSYCKYMPIETWTYDATIDKWELVRRFEPGKDVPTDCNFGFRHNYLHTRVAVNTDDVVVLIQPGNPGQTWLCRLDASGSDATGTAKFGVKPGTVERRTGFYDPKWYAEGVPPADPAKVKAELDALPANKWVRRNPPKVPKPNMDWGSAAFLSKADMIARFSGGHSAYSGTSPHFYDPGTDRWSLPFAPETPIDHCGTEHGAPGEWSFKGNPWMPAHSWKATGSDPAGERLAYIGGSFTYFIGPRDSKWTRGMERHPWHDVRATTLCTTRDALIAWAVENKGGVGHSSMLCKVDTVTGAWKRLPVIGTLPKAVGFDMGGLSWDSKRDRLLIFSPQEKGHEGDVMAYDMRTGEAKWLAPAGKGQAGVSARETVYLPESDMVMLGAHAPLADGRKVWPLYDCGKNAWFGAELSGVDPDPLVNRYTKENAPFNVSLGMVYDPNRKLVWMVGQESEITVLKFDSKTANLVEFK